jgi:hypothetical protein
LHHLSFKVVKKKRQRRENSSPVLNVLKQYFSVKLFTVVDCDQCLGGTFWLNLQGRDSCRPLFKKLQILTVPSQYIYSLFGFVVKNKNLFTSNFEIYKVHTRTMNNFHLSLVNLTMTQKGVLCSGSRLFNSLPTQIKCLSDYVKIFHRKLSSFLLQHTLYNLD